MDHYLLTTDFSSISLNAEVYGFKMAAANKAFVTILHIIDEDADVEEAGNKLLNRRNEISKLAGVAVSSANCELIIRKGKVTKEVQVYAESVKANLVIAGTHGLGFLQGKFLGSHASSLIKNLYFPVMLIPENFQFQALDKVVFAVEMREGETKVVDFLNSFEVIKNAQITLLHVVETPYVELENEQWELFKKKIAENNNKLKFDLVVNSNVPLALNEYCEKNKANALIICPHKRGVLGWLYDSNSGKQIAYKTKVPLLAVPDFFDPAVNDFWNLIFPNSPN